MANLETTVAGITFPNPFILASGPPTNNGTMIKTAFDAGWGGAVLKTVALDPTPLASPRVHTLRRRRQQLGMVNIELLTDIPIDTWKDDLDRIRQAHPIRPIIVSVMGGGQAEEWAEVMHRLEPHGVTAYELNVSCPNISGKKGAQLGQDPDSVARVVGWAKAATALPVLVKLTPNVTDIVHIARVAREAGADAITATNTLSGLAGIDLEALTPLPTVKDIGIFGGYSGPGLKPVSLRCAASIAQAVDVPLIGCGGIERWQDVAEYISVGCSAVQMCTAPMWHGFSLVDKLSRGLESYLESHGYASPMGLRGQALANLVGYDNLDMSQKLLAHVDTEACTGCGLCVPACDSGAYQAIVMQDKLAVILPDKCDGCGLCVGVCPTNAISMGKRPTRTV